MWSAVVAGSRQDKSASCTRLFLPFGKTDAIKSLYALINRICVDISRLLNSKSSENCRCSRISLSDTTEPSHWAIRSFFYTITYLGRTGIN